MKTLIVALIIYSIVGIFVAFSRISKWQRFCDFIATVPTGDEEYFEGPELFGLDNYIFITSLPIMFGYVMLCKMINR